MSTLWGSLYDLSLWGPIALAVLGALAVVLVTQWHAISLPGALAVAGLTGTAAWAGLSTLWAESVPNAELDASRWVFYAAVLVSILLVVRTREHRFVLVFAPAVSGAAVVIGLTVILVMGHPGNLFFHSRLFNPIGYSNGEACALLMVFWPLIALAESPNVAWRRFVGAAVAILALGLGLLTVSRGAVFALIVSGVVLLCLFDGRVRRGWLLVFVLGAAGVAAPSLLHVSQGSAATLSAAAAHRSGRVLLASAVVAGFAWAFLPKAVRPFMHRDPRRGRQLAAIALVALAVATAGGGLIAVGNPVARIRNAVHSFTHLSAATSNQARLLSGGGNRYDYWRVALDEFLSAPVLGVGAGNYTRDYFRLRRTNEDIQQPHSLELQTLAELGIPGLLLLALGLAGVGSALWRWAASAHARSQDSLVGVAAGGVMCVWLAQTSVDWMHLLPGLTLTAICAAVAIMPPSIARAQTGVTRWAVRIVALCLAAVAASFIARLVVAQQLNSQAQADVARDPVRAIRLADDSLNVEPGVMAALFTKSAAFARLNNYVAARAVLDQAAKLEPHNFAPPALLGDLAMRHGQPQTAVREYERALMLNPLEVGLRAALTAAQDAAGRS